MTAPEFDWNSDDHAVVCHLQPRTVCYWNPHGQAVVRQEAVGYGDDDSFVFVSVEFLPALIRQLSDMLDEAGFNPADHDPALLRQLAVDPDTGKAPVTSRSTVTPAKRNGTGAASRQRRYRERHRNVTRDVTPAVTGNDNPAPRQSDLSLQAAE